MSGSNSSRLAKAMRLKRFIRFSRRFEESNIRGYVLDVGPRFFLISLVSDRIRFDGFECFRLADVRGVGPDPYSEFAESALKLRGERRPKKPRVSVKSTGDLLLSASRAFPLVTIHREKVDPDICWIGRVLGVEHGHVSLLEINPDASWDDNATKFKISEITRVNFGGDYENALFSVGGGSGLNGLSFRHPSFYLTSSTRNTPQTPPQIQQTTNSHTNPAPQERPIPPAPSPLPEPARAPRAN